VPRQFKFMTDSLMVAEIAAENLLVPVVDPSPWFHTSLTQTGTDFGFIKQLAANNLFDAYVYWDQLHFELPVQTQVQRQLPAAQGAAHDQRERLPDRVRHHPAGGILAARAHPQDDRRRDHPAQGPGREVLRRLRREGS
jgi:hypothetical protein